MNFIKNVLYILKGHDAQGEITALKSKLAVSKQNERKALEEKNGAEVASRNLNDKLIAESKEKKEYSDKVNSLENRNKELNKRYNELSAAKTEVEQELEASKELSESLSAENKRQRKDIESLRSDNDAYKKDIDNRRKSLQSLQEELDKARSDSNKAETEWKNKYADKEKEIRELTAEINSLNECIGAKDEKLKGKDKLIEAGKAETSKIDNDWNSKYSLLEQQNGELSSKIDSLNASLTSKVEELRGKEKENKQLSTTVAELKGKMAAQNNTQPAASTDELRRLENELQKAEEDIQKKRQEINDLKGSVAQKEKDYNSLKDKYLELSSNHAGVENYIKTLEKRIQELTDANTRLQEELSKALTSAPTKFSDKEENAKEETNAKKDDVTNEDSAQKGVEDSSDKHIEHTIEESKEEGSTEMQTSVATPEYSDEQQKPEKVKEDKSESDQSSIDSNEDVLSKDTKTGSSKTKAKSKIEEALTLSQGSIEEGKDFPEIYNDSKRGALRSIRRVVNQEDQSTIIADNFFDNSSAEEIATMSRRLSEAYIDHKPLWTCELCGKPVKIAHRLRTLFFIHGDREGYCPWRNPSAKSQDDIYIDDLKLAENVTVDDNFKPKYQELKEKIYKALVTEESKKMGIDDVRMDEVMHGNTGFLRWRRPDISFTYKNHEWAIELQKKSHDTNFIVDKDKFYRLNHVQVLWIFGSDSDTSYDYMRGFNYKETLFDNHCNVFVFDKDAQKETENNSVLKLKCNWLKEDGSWAYTIEDQGENGRMVGLDELITDDVYCKPYFTNANELYFKSHEQAHNEFEKSHLLTNEELAQKAEEAWTESCEYQKAIEEMKAHGLSATAFTIKGLWGFKYGTTVLIVPVFTQKPIEINDGYYQVYQGGKFGIVNKYAQNVIDWNISLECDFVKYDQDNNRILFERDGLWGVADNKGKILIEPDYKDVCNWSKRIYRVKKRQWGLIDINNALVLNCYFSSIGELTGGRALVKRVHPLDILRMVSGYIDSDGSPIISQENKQVDTNSTILGLGLWGVKGLDGRKIIPFQYDAIEYWSDNLYKVEVNNKWGIIRIPQGNYLLNIEYDRIDNLKEGKATITKDSIIRSIDKNGNDVAQESIPLKGGLKKTKISGKWGIIDNEGNIIIPHSYDEIGSFRSRLIGIINKNVIKLNVDYNYPIHVCGKVSSSGIGCIYVEIAGVKCRINEVNMMKQTVHSLFGSNNECRILAFMNINFGNKQYNLRVLPKNKTNIILSHGDKNSDFSIGETLIGTVIGHKRNNRKISRLMVKFDDGRETKVTRQLFLRSGQDITFYRKGSKIKLRKDGFNDEFDQTIWKIL